MRYPIIAAMVLTTSIFGTSLAATAPTTTEPTLNSDRDKLSYSMGAMTGKTFKAHNIDVDPRFFALGFDDALRGNKTLLSEQEMQQIIQNFQKQSQSQALSKQKEISADNLKKGQAFLQQNSKQPGVITLPSGLQYKVIKKGTGPKPTASDTVVVNYEGRLIDGKVFDSSYQRGQPASFPVNQVVKGWQDALVMMPVGSEWELYLPPDLAYGDADIPNIGPNQVLIFKINLISIKNQN